MSRLTKLLGCVGALLFSGLAVAYADPSTKIALVPGGPHPYFASWAQAGADAKKDFNLGAADYKVPEQWQLADQNNLLESLVTQGYNGFLLFPGDPVGSVSTVQELTDSGAPVIALAGCLKELEARHSAAIRAAFLDGATYEELAARMKVPLGTMKSWIRRGLLKLRACLEQ